MCDCYTMKTSHIYHRCNVYIYIYIYISICIYIYMYIYMLYIYIYIYTFIYVAFPMKYRMSWFIHLHLKFPHLQVDIPHKPNRWPVVMCVNLAIVWEPSPCRIASYWVRGPNTQLFMGFRCLHMFIHVYNCLHMFIHVYNCLYMFLLAYASMKWKGYGIICRIDRQIIRYSNVASEKNSTRNSLMIFPAISKSCL